MPAGTVIVVPGFGGTTLSYRGGTGGATKLWWNPTRILLNTPLSMALAGDGVSPFPVVGKTLFPSGPVDMGIYEPLLTHLANAGYKAQFWGYDWRLSADQLAAKLAIFLTQGNFALPVSLVCHSFGGVVAQLAYPQVQAISPAFPWVKTVYLGTPHGGAHWASAALNGIYFDGCELLMFAQLLNIGATFIPGSKPLFGAIEKTLALTVGSWPGLYCLMPNSFGEWAQYDPSAAICLNPATYAGGPGGINPGWLTVAGQVQRDLVANLALPRPAEVSLYGLDFSTMATFKDRTDLQSVSGYGFSLTGDGTVIEQRATLLGGRSVGFKRTAHNALCNTLGPLNEVLTVLAGTLPEDEVQANPIGVVNAPPQQFLTIVNPPLTNPFANRHSDP